LFVSLGTGSVVVVTDAVGDGCCPLLTGPAPVARHTGTGKSAALRQFAPAGALVEVVVAELKLPVSPENLYRKFVDFLSMETFHNYIGHMYVFME
jgi:hypothetical protein